MGVRLLVFFCQSLRQEFIKLQIGHVWLKLAVIQLTYSVLILGLIQGYGKAVVQVCVFAFHLGPVSCFLRSTQDIISTRGCALQFTSVDFPQGDNVGFALFIILRTSTIPRVEGFVPADLLINQGRHKCRGYRLALTFQK